MVYYESDGVSLLEARSSLKCLFPESVTVLPEYKFLCMCYLAASVTAPQFEVRSVYIRSPHANNLFSEHGQLDLLQANKQLRLRPVPPLSETAISSPAGSSSSLSASGTRSVVLVDRPTAVFHISPRRRWSQASRAHAARSSHSRLLAAHQS